MAAEPTEVLLACRTLIMMLYKPVYEQVANHDDLNSDMPASNRRAPCFSAAHGRGQPAKRPAAAVLPRAGGRERQADARPNRLQHVRPSAAHSRSPNSQAAFCKRCHSAFQSSPWGDDGTILLAVWLCNCNCDVSPIWSPCRFRYVAQENIEVLPAEVGCAAAYAVATSMYDAG